MVSPTVKWTAKSVSNSNGVTTQMAMWPKEKHKKMQNSIDFSKIEINGDLLDVLNFNLMIPIEEEQLQLVDTTIFYAFYFKF